MKLAGYVRVSTQGQTEGLGPEIQEDTIRDWASSHGHTILLWCQDLATSGTNTLEHRPQLGVAMSALKEGFVEGLVVYRLDRLARDLVLQETLIAEIRRTGGEVFSTSDGEDAMLRDDGDPSRKLIRQVLGAVAEYERAMIVLRMAAGRNAKRRRGGYSGGRPPYGYAAIGGQLVPRADEQDVLRGIMGLADQHWSMERIADFLNRQEILPRHGPRWAPSTIHSIVRRNRTKPARR